MNLHCGIITASDITQEWLLPWWWEHYQSKNSFPVAFVDLGMSFEMKEWCKKRGALIPLRLFDFATEKKEMDPLFVQNLEKMFGTQFWECRNAWFKKPFACLKTPFQKTLWLDLDCEVRQPLTSLFQYNTLNIAMAKDQNDPPTPYPIYNSGVILFQQSAFSLLEEWGRWCVEKNGQFRGDQEVFSHWIGEKKIEIAELPPLYNWSRCSEARPDAVIQHWHGKYGKLEIKNQILYRT